MPTIYLIRHGETPSNREGRFRGLDDVPLSARGERQAGLVARAFEGRRLDAVLTSPLRRARGTAEPVARARGLEPVVEPALTDLDFGEWTGRTLEEVRAGWPGLWERWRGSPERVVFRGGGSLEEVAARACARVRELASGPHEAVAVVSHRVVLKLLVLEALGLGAKGFFRVRLDPASITEIGAGEPPQLVRLNDCSHLGEEGSAPRDF